MSRVYRTHNPQHVFKNCTEIEEHILSKASGNTNGRIGTELELFLTTAEGKPATFDQVETVMISLAHFFEEEGVKTTCVTENDRVVGLNIPQLGDICLEPGGQIEISTRPCVDLTVLGFVNEEMKKAVKTAASFAGLKVNGTGHMPAFLAAEDMPRSRFHAYYAYCRDQYGAAAEDLINTMKSVSGLQVNLDPMGEKFHEIYRALLLVDVAHALAFPGERAKRLHETYAKLSPEQLSPLFNALAARTNDQLATHIVARLLTIKLPFMPDATTAEGYKSAIEVFGHAPRLGELLDKGLLTAEILDNALSLQLTMPNIRRHGVLETRAPDSVNNTEALMTVASKYYTFAYDDKARQELLATFSAIDPHKLADCFAQRFDLGADQLAQFDLGSGIKAGDLVAFTLAQHVSSAMFKKTVAPKI